MSKSTIILQQFELGPLQNFLYFLGDGSTNEIAVIDPAWDINFLIKEARRQKFKITAVFLTHGHPDHVNGLAAMLSQCDVPAYICKKESEFFKPRHKNLIETAPGESLRIGSLEIKTLHTPGHSPGCQCFWVENYLISGDAIFINGCGRCDLPGSDPKQMYDSLYNKIMKLPDETVIYPGHNYGPVPFDTVANQKKTNPYLRCKNINEFLQERMGVYL